MSNKKLNEMDDEELNNLIAKRMEKYVIFRKLTYYSFLVHSSILAIYSFYYFFVDDKNTRYFITAQYGVVLIFFLSLHHKTNASDSRYAEKSISEKRFYIRTFWARVLAEILYMVLTWVFNIYLLYFMLIK